MLVYIDWSGCRDGKLKYKKNLSKLFFLFAEMLTNPIHQLVLLALDRHCIRFVFNVHDVTTQKKTLSCFKSSFCLWNLQVFCLFVFCQKCRWFLYFWTGLFIVKDLCQQPPCKESALCNFQTKPPAVPSMICTLILQMWHLEPNCNARDEDDVFCLKLMQWRNDIFLVICFLSLNVHTCYSDVIWYENIVHNKVFVVQLLCCVQYFHIWGFL